MRWYLNPVNLRGWPGRDDRGQFLRRQLETDVAVKIPVRRVARITVLRAPHLPAGFPVARERRRSRRGEARRVDRPLGPGLAVHQAVRVEDEPAQVRLLEHLVDPRHVGAFRQPDARRVAPETLAVIVPGDKDLRAHGLRNVLHQRQQPVGRRAGDDFQITRVLKPPERRDEVALPAFEVLAAAAAQPFEVEMRRLLQSGPGRACGPAPSPPARASGRDSGDNARAAAGRAASRRAAASASASAQREPYRRPAGRKRRASGRYVSVIAS